ncbi:MAG: precorrin-4 C(11)-methyltransferase [Pseudomonadota bacterium]|nr:precorrin-4 C(11)-methyltransferase [Pseudomonadota bacterium]
MTVHFIGAGPGAPDLVTLRAINLIKDCKVCLYAGSLVPKSIVAYAPSDAEVIDTSSLHLDQIIEKIKEFDKNGLHVARVHSGDPSIYGAIAEQMRQLDAAGIDYDVTPGVSAYAAAAATLNKELTLPEVSQTVIITRTGGKASGMPVSEDLASLASSRSTLAIHLSIRNLKRIINDLIPHYGEDCPIYVVYRVTWPDQKILAGTLSNIYPKVRAEKITRTAIILVGHVLGHDNFVDSQLYNKDYHHILRTR